MGNYNLNDLNDLLNQQNQPVNVLGGWYVASLVLAVVGAILVVLLFLNKNNKTKLKGAAKWLYDFLNFDFIALETILKALYTGVTIFIILNSFNYISIDFLQFIVYLFGGLVVSRLLFELILMFIKIWRNTTEINNKLQK